MTRSRLLTLAPLCALWLLAAPGCGDDDGQPGADAATDAAVADAAPQADAAPDAGPTTECTETPRDFWLYDLSVMPPQYVQETFTCRARGTHGMVWVADSLWNAPMTQADVDGVLTAFDQSTPADPAQGIYALTAGTFGEPTDVDADDRVNLLYYELQGYGSFEFDGFIRAEDVLGGQASNNAEILYLDGARNDVAGEYMLGVVAHELQHLIHLAYDVNEDQWLNETLSEASMLVSGYLGDLEGWVIGDFLPNPAVSLTASDASYNYGAGFLFGAYLLERYGPDLLTALVEAPGNGVASLDAVLAAQGEAEDFAALLRDWVVANLLDAPGLEDGRYGYTGFDLPLPGSYATTLPATAVLRTNPPHAARYFTYELDVAEGSTVTVTLNSTDWARLAVRWAAYPAGDRTAAVVGAHTPGAEVEPFTVTGLGGTIDRLTVIVLETAGASDASYRVSAVTP